MESKEDKKKLVSRGWDSFDRSFTIDDCYVDKSILEPCVKNYNLSTNNISEQIDSLTEQVNNTVVSLDGLKEVIDKLPVETYNKAGVSQVLFSGMIHKIKRRDFKTSF